jgi:hypothetical protein
MPWGGDNRLQDQATANQNALYHWWLWWRGVIFVLSPVSSIFFDTRVEKLHCEQRGVRCTLSSSHSFGLR